MQANQTGALSALKSIMVHHVPWVGLAFVLMFPMGAQADPSFIVHIYADSLHDMLSSGYYLRVTQENDGTVPLVDPFVDFEYGVSNFSQPSHHINLDRVFLYSKGDLDNDSILEPGEQWEWLGKLTGEVVEEPFFVIAIGHGTDPLNNDVTYCTNPGSPPPNTVCADEARQEIQVDVYRSMPTLSEWGIIVLAVLVIGAGAWTIVRRRSASSLT